MKKYIGTKHVEAEPMTMDEAYEKELPSIKNYKVSMKDTEGYYVKYEDGYENWYPKEVFEQVYKIADTPLDRMDIEEGELADRLGKLQKFINGEKFKELDTITRAMLIAQYAHMKGYLHVLYERLMRMSGREGNFSGFPFSTAIDLLREGFAVRRSGWNGKNLFVIKQVPAHIESDIIPKMQSLPQSAKDLILNGKGFIDYTSQCLIYNGNTGRADSWVPSISDVFANDWEIVE